MTPLVIEGAAKKSCLVGMLREKMFNGVQQIKSLFNFQLHGPIITTTGRLVEKLKRTTRPTSIASPKWPSLVQRVQIIGMRSNQMD